MSALAFFEPAFRQAAAHELRRGSDGMAEAMRHPVFYAAVRPVMADNALRAAKRGDLAQAERDVIAIMDTARRCA